MPDYPGYSFTVLPAASSIPDTSPVSIPDLEGCIGSLRPTGDFLAARVNKSIKRDRYTHKNYANSRANIHFQGFQRTRGGIHAFLSGGDRLEPAAHLFTLEMSSRTPGTGWCSNVHSGKAPLEDKVVKVTALSTDHWHAGGLGLLGQVLAVPLEGTNRPARTIFLDVTDPVDPKHLVALDIKGKTSAAGAAALTRLPGQRYLCAIHRDEGKSSHLDLYLSKTTDLADGWKPASPDWTYSQAINRRGKRQRYQHIALLLGAEQPDDPEAGLYLLGTQNDKDSAPIPQGVNTVDLFRIELGGTAAAPSFAGLKITQLGSFPLQCEFGWGSFAAAGGIHVDTCGRVNLYAGGHWQDGGLIRLMEFRCGIADSALAIDSLDRGWIELYEYPRFKGRCLTIFGRQGSEIEDYDKLIVQRGKLDNRISSIRYQLPPGTIYQLYDGPHYTGTVTGDLIGAGLVVNLPDLRQDLPQLDDRISSSQFV